MNSVKLQCIRLIDRNMLHSCILMKNYQEGALKNNSIFNYIEKNGYYIYTKKKKTGNNKCWRECGREPSCTVSENVNWCSLCGKLYEVLL